MRIDIVTLFPEMFAGPFGESIIKRAVERGLVEIYLHNLRDYGLGRHRQVDDYPYGGGPGMILRVEPLFAAVEEVKARIGREDIPVILLSPQGRLFNQEVAEELAQQPNLILICGHYEGVDERVREHLVTDELSIGDYILTGGELPAMVVVDAVVRLLPGALGAEEGAREDSYAMGLLEYPQYTRPREFRGWTVPEILLSGNHAEIAKWRLEQALKRTRERRPDLLEKLSEEERKRLGLV
ncbi:MAG: tRNA (guanosine(37)-N1)-methyltransferase TrmD [Chloroflexi bacterium]|nr:MAG: tRNA (guanosine(37)-N1)-methyltransferase TrmD [Chloroflexota bacterium]